MKKIELICVGKIKDDFIKSGIAEYKKRLSRFCEVSIIEIFESTVKKETDEILLKALPTAILFDKEGEQISSENLAKFIDTAFLSTSKLQFIIGGSNGVDSARFTKKISFGSVTYPHRLFRLIALEQLYRAFTILEGLPYHK